MSSIKVSTFKRSNFDVNALQAPISTDTKDLTQLDLFDPFDPIDRSLCDFFYLQESVHHEPQVASDTQPRYPEKYRITYNCKGFSRDSVETNISNNKLVITASEKTTDDEDNYSFKEFKRTFVLPRYVNTDRALSFFLPDSELIVVEIPIHLLQKWHKKMIQPKIHNNGKSVRLEVLLPERVNGETLNIVRKDQDVVLIADYKHIRDDHVTDDHLFKIQYIRRATFPQNTCFSTLRCVSENGEIHITADLIHIDKVTF